MIRLASAAACFALASCAWAGEPPPRELMGAWSVVSAQRDGREQAFATNQSLRLVFVADTLDWQDHQLTGGGRSPSLTGYSYALDTSHEPAVMTLIPARPRPGEHARRSALMALAGDTLRLCLAPPGEGPPREFAAEPGSGNYLLVLRREAP